MVNHCSKDYFSMHTLDLGCPSPENGLVCKASKFNPIALDPPKCLDTDFEPDSLFLLPESVSHLP